MSTPGRKGRQHRANERFTASTTSPDQPIAPDSHEREAPPMTSTTAQTPPATNAGRSGRRKPRVAQSVAPPSAEPASPSLAVSAVPTSRVGQWIYLRYGRTGTRAAALAINLILDVAVLVVFYILSIAIAASVVPNTVTFVARGTRVAPDTVAGLLPAVFLIGLLFVALLKIMGGLWSLRRRLQLWITSVLVAGPKEASTSVTVTR